ncbi:hypothetical protein LINGRAHAP2_LOCUS7974 [Linum grandiflorum]
MIILSWNCRVLGQPRIARVLGDRVRENPPDLVCLMETLTGNASMEDIRLELQFAECFIVAANGHISGLCLLWR